MKKQLFVTILFLTALFTLGGCGSKEENKLEVFSTKMENKDMLQKLADDYMVLHPEVKIELSAPPDAGTVLRTKLTKNRVPDVIFMGGDSTYTDLQGAGILMNLTAEPSAADLKEAYKEQVYSLNEDKSEQLFGIPYATNAAGVIYNKDIFSEHNIVIPKTYTEFLSVCEQLKSEGVTPIYFTLKDSWTAANIWNALAGNVIPREFGQERLDNKTTFAGTHEELLTKIIEITKYGQEDIMGMGYDDGNIAFAGGKAAMMIQGNWVIPNIRKSNPDINLDMFTLPSGDVAGDNKITSGIDVMATISVTTKQEALAKDFLSFVTEKENIGAYINNQFAFSAADGVEQEDPAVNGLKEDFMEGKITEFVDHYYPVGFDVGAQVQSYIGKQGDMDAVLKEMDKNFDKYNKK